MIRTELEDKAITMMQLLCNASGAEFDDEEMAVSIMVETFKNIQDSKKIIVLGHDGHINQLAKHLDTIGFDFPLINVNDPNPFTNPFEPEPLTITEVVHDFGKVDLNFFEHTSKFHK